MQRDPRRVNKRLTHWCRSAAIVAAASMSACRYDATEVLVIVDTNAPIEAELTLTASVERTEAPGVSRVEHSWHRPSGSPMSLPFPSSFAVTPRATGPRNDAVILSLEAVVEGIGPAGTPVHLRREARFRFTERHANEIRLFLAMECGAPATGCHSVATDGCTVGALCEEQGLTCGEGGRCESVDVQPTPPTDAAVADAMPTDASSDPDDGTVPIDVVTDAMDTGTGSDAGVDGSTGVVACPFWQVGGAIDSPTPLTTLNSTQAESYPTLSPDGLTIYFSRIATASPVLMFATRTSLSAQFSAPATVTDFPTIPYTAQLSLDATGLNGYIAATPSGAGSFQIVRIFRTRLTDPFQTANVTGINSSNNEYSIGLTTDARRAYVARAGTLYQADIAADHVTFSNVQAVSGIGGSNSDTPIPLANDTVLVFSSHRSGNSNEHLYYTTRATATAPWGSVAPVPTINGPDASTVQYGVYVRPDGCEIIYASRSTSNSDYNLFHAFTHGP